MSLQSTCAQERGDERLPNINDITTAVYKLLKADETLGGLCTLYKGSKRPNRATNPSVTVETKRLEPGEGEGLWMCDVVTTAFTDNQANGMPDHECLDAIVSGLYLVLEDAEISLENARALPLIRGDIGGPSWNNTHEGETSQECTFGLIFIKYD